MRLPPRRIHLADTDATGVAYAGRLADLALQRLEEALAATGLDPATTLTGPAGPVVAQLDTTFHAPARLGQRLPATVVCAAIGTSSARFTVRLGRAVTANVVLVWIDRGTGSPAPWPTSVRRRLGRLGTA